MNRLTKWIFCGLDDTVRAALMFTLAAAALNLTERASRRSGAHDPTNDAVGELFDPDGYSFEVVHKS